MISEEFVKKEIEEIVTKYKNGFMLSGSKMSERDELFLRNGIATGIQIAGLTLNNIDCTDILKVKPSELTNQNNN